VLGTNEWLVIRIIALVAAVAGMAYVLNLPSTQQLQRRLGITQLAVAGLPLIVLGMLTRAPQLGVLSDALLDQLSPIVGIALAGVGIRIGLRLDIPHLVGTPRSIAMVALVRLAVPWVVMAGAGVLAMRFLGIQGGDDVRNAALLATAATVSSAMAARQLSGVLVTEDISISQRAAQLIELACVIGFLLITAYAHGRHSTLAPEVWLLTAVGLAVVLGTCAALLFRDRAARGVDAPVIAIGTVAMVAGAAMFLGFSPLPIGLLVGMTVGVVAGDRRAELESAFDDYQRLIYGLLLFILGAVAVPLEVSAALVALAFVVGRVLGSLVSRPISVRVARLEIAASTKRQFEAAPMGATAVALVLSAHLLYPNSIAQAGAITVVLATIVTEAILHARSPKS
jgi:hypothetical protein